MRHEVIHKRMLLARLGVHRWPPGEHGLFTFKFFVMVENLRLLLCPARSLFGAQARNGFDSSEMVWVAHVVNQLTASAA